MTAPCPTSPTPTSPGKHTNNRGAVTLLREVLRRLEGWQYSLSGGGNVKLVRGEMADVGCDIDDFLDKCRRKG